MSVNPYNKETEPASWHWYEEKPKEGKTVKERLYTEKDLISSIAFVLSKTKGLTGGVTISEINAYLDEKK